MSAISQAHPKPGGFPRARTAIFALLWAVAFGLGLYGLVQRFAYGHEIANYGGYVPWGLWVAIYTYLIGLSAGAFWFAALAYVGGIRRLERVGKIALFVALIALISGLLTIWLDLGHLERFYELYIRPNPSSIMAWMVWFYSAYFILLVVGLWFALRADLVEAKSRSGLARILAFGSADTSATARAGDRKVLKVLTIIGVPLVLALNGGSGALFGVLGARAYWNSALYPILFLVSALASGGALLTFVVAALWPERRSAEFRDLVYLLGRLTLGFLTLDLLFEWAEISISLYASIPAASEAYRAMLYGPYWWAFWLVHLAVGAVIPALILLVRPRSVGWVALAGLLIAVAFLAVRLNIVVPGQVIPEMTGLEAAYQEAGLTFQYAPSLAEWLVGLFVGAFAVLLFAIGFTSLPLSTKSSEES